MNSNDAPNSTVTFFDTCVRIGHSAAPDPPGNVVGVKELLACMTKLNITHAVVEHAVAREASPRLGLVCASDVPDNDKAKMFGKNMRALMARCA